MTPVQGKLKLCSTFMLVCAPSSKNYEIGTHHRCRENVPIIAVSDTLTQNKAMDKAAIRENSVKLYLQRLVNNGWLDFSNF